MIWAGLNNNRGGTLPPTQAMVKLGQYFVGEVSLPNPNSLDTFVSLTLKLTPTATLTPPRRPPEPRVKLGQYFKGEVKSAPVALTQP